MRRRQPVTDHELPEWWWECWVEDWTDDADQLVAHRLWRDARSDWAKERGLDMADLPRAAVYYPQFRYR